MLLLRNKEQQQSNALASFMMFWVCRRRSGHEWTASSSLHHTRAVKLRSFALQQDFWENLLLGIAFIFLRRFEFDFHSAVMAAAVTHTSESCRSLFAQLVSYINTSSVLALVQYYAMPVNKMLLQELNQFHRNRDADFRFSINFWFLVPIAGGKMPDSPLLHTPMKVAHSIFEKQMTLKKFQVDLATLCEHESVNFCFFGCFQRKQ